MCIHNGLYDLYGHYLVPAGIPRIQWLIPGYEIERFLTSEYFLGKQGRY